MIVICPAFLLSLLLTIIYQNRVEKTVLASSSASSSASAVPTKSGSSLDAALEILKGPKAISTVVKSSNDWDNFKEKEGLQDDLAAASKDG